MCGEKALKYIVKAQDKGSPPRVRGKDDKIAPLLPELGITPACAGKREKGSSTLIGSWDHPRVCGEKCLFALHHALSLGSPPRVRGKVCTHLWTVERDRITPACAGKSAGSRGNPAQRGDHPRVCGEKDSCLSRF